LLSKDEENFHSSIPRLSAKILKINFNEQLDGTVAAPVTVDVCYISDNSKELAVDVRRLLTRSNGYSFPNPKPFVAALHDLSSQIASLTPNRPDVCDSILDGFDEELFVQMVHQGVLSPDTDLHPILLRVQTVLRSLQAPTRTSATDQWIQNIEQIFMRRSTAATPRVHLEDAVRSLPSFFERANKIVNEIKRDMGNYYISVLVPVFHKYGYYYLREQFRNRVFRGDCFLDATTSLICSVVRPDTAFKSTVDMLTECGACASEGFSFSELLEDAVKKDKDITANINDHQKTRDLCTGVVAVSLLALLQLPVRLNNFDALYFVPETLLWDVDRLALVRDYVDRISLECSILIAAKQVLALFKLPQWCSNRAADEELQSRLDVLVTEKDSSLPSVVSEVVRFVIDSIEKFKESFSKSDIIAIESHPALQASNEEIIERVSKAVKDVVSPGNPVLALFTRRLYKILLRSMLNLDVESVLVSYSLNAAAQKRNIKYMTQIASNVFRHSIAVHIEFYRFIIFSAQHVK
jgi:hypothetical protein